MNYQEFYDGKREYKHIDDDIDEQMIDMPKRALKTEVDSWTKYCKGSPINSDAYITGIDSISEISKCELVKVKSVTKQEFKRLQREDIMNEWEELKIA